MSDFRQRLIDHAVARDPVAIHSTRTDGGSPCVVVGRVVSIAIAPWGTSAVILIGVSRIVEITPADALDPRERSRIAGEQARGIGGWS
jgi:hypothetical protein